MGRLMYGLNPLEISGRRVGPAFGDQPVPEPFPFEILGSVWPAMGVGPGPKVPTVGILIILTYIREIFFYLLFYLVLIIDGHSLISCHISI